MDEVSQDNALVEGESLLDYLKAKPETTEALSGYTPLTITSYVAAGLGGGCIGWAIAPRLAPFAAGLGLLGVTSLLASAANARLWRAIEIHNESLRKPATTLRVEPTSLTLSW